jgi:lysophospholipase L1-like esterase
MKDLTRIKKLLRSEAGITWVFAGDSITHGSVHLMEYRSYVQLFEERVRTELHRPQDVVINTGVGGWRLRDIQEHRHRVIHRFQPTILNLAIGMNDAAHVAPDDIPSWSEDLAALLGEVREKWGAALVLHTPPPADTFSLRPMAENRRYVPAFCAAIRAVAKRTGAVLVDHEMFWQERIGTNDRLLLFCQSDTIHPNTYGHRMMFECLSRRLGIWDPDSILGRLFQHR